jgi:hypothetical protein
MTIDIENLTAALEREVVGVDDNTTNFRIQMVLSSVYIDQLTQQFYNQPHNGSLQNYTILYRSVNLDAPSTYGYAFFTIRTDHTTSSSNITTEVTVPHSASDNWETLNGEGVILTADTNYSAMIDGTNLIEDSGVYPQVIWWSEDSPGVFDSGWHLNTWQMNRDYEAVMNYTYIPWNKTSNSALLFSPSTIDLQINQSSISSSSINVTSTNGNLTQLDFNSNQSVYLNYNMTLWFSRNATTTASWDINTAGDIVEWNSTTPVTYPSVAGGFEKFLNISIPNGWSIDGLYNSSSPSTNHGNYVTVDGNIRCSNLTNGTWTLSSSGFNHVTALDLYDDSSGSPLGTETSILTAVEINSTIQDSSAIPADSSSTNLTIWRAGSVEWAPMNESVVVGRTSYLWDIDSTSSENGFYTIEIYWTNGTQAGYDTVDLVVYYPTTLTPAQSQLDAFTEDTFPISVYFEDTATPQGLDGTYASVVYSFDGGTNTSMTDHGNGTWTASVSTTGKSPGMYSVYVYAEGYALVNRTTTIDATLIHETQPLSVSFLNGTAITYVESTTLAVTYRRVNGANVTGATVNVTIDSDVWELSWHAASQTYRLTFNGTDAPGFDTHSLTIQAWRNGYLEQNDTANSLTIGEEPTSLDLQWFDDYNITYVETTTLQANFSMSNGTAITNAIINVTIGLDTWELVWHSLSQTYRLVFNGTDDPPGFGTYLITIEGWKYGYVTQADSTEQLVLRKEPTSIEYEWSNTNTISFVDSTILYINYTMSDGSAVTGATVNTTIGATTWPTSWDGGSSRYYIQFNGDDSPPGIGGHSIEVKAWRYGFDEQTDSSQTLNINDEATTILSFWSPGSTITYADSSFLFVNYWMSNSSPISSAQVNMTIGSDLWPLTWDTDNQAYKIQFNGSDNPPDLGTHPISISAWRHGFASKTDSSSVTLTVEPTTLATGWSNTNSPSFFDYSLFFVYYRMTDNTPITGATVNVTIGLDVWIMTWNGTEEAYQMRFNGSDNPPGVGTHSLTVQAWRYGFQDRSDSSAMLTLPDIPTSINISWTNGNSITYVQQTVLQVNYSDYTGVELSSATVNVTIGGTTWNLVWNGGLSVYEYTFKGSDSPPGIGTHSLTVNAWQTDYVSQSDSSESLEIVEESTSVTITWLYNDNITYVEQTILSVQYLMSNGTPISDGTLNVTINGLFRTLVWIPSTDSYNVTFYGTEDPPGLGTHSVSVIAWKFGYEASLDNSESLTIRDAETNLVVSWLNSNTISYVGETTLDVSYELTNGSSIVGATVNVTIVSTTWVLTWNGGTESYQFTFYGDDNPPGLGSHTLTIRAWREKYTEQTDSSETFDIIEETTAVQNEWSNGNDITYVGFSILSINYTMSNGTAISGAIVNVTISSTTWDMQWHAPTMTYQLRFNGSDEPPGLGTHGLTVRAWRFGFEDQVDGSLTLSISGELGSVDSQWLGLDNITFVESTILQVNYTMSNGTAIPSAWVNVTIDTVTWDLTWHSASETYRLMFNGTDSPPGFGTHTLTIKAWRDGFDGVTDSSLDLTLRDEETTLTIEWFHTSVITYFGFTTLRASYLMSNGTPIADAVVNASIGLDLWTLTWNDTTGYFEKLFLGSDDPPGLGTHSLLIQASRFGFEPLSDSSETITLQKDPTSLNVSWAPQNSISFIEQTLLIVEYEMSNETAIKGAIVNVTIDGTTWLLSWNPTQMWYEILFNGTDDPPGLGTHSLRINASKTVFQEQTTTESLIISEDMTSVTSSWLTNTIDWTESVVIAFNYTDSVGTLIPDATVKTIFINGTMYSLQGTNGTYWFEFNNSLDLGLHNIAANFTKPGYTYSYISGITLEIEIANTTLQVSWNTAVIDYLGQADVTVDYQYSGTGQSVPWLGVVANITVDSTVTLSMNRSGNLWIANLTGLDLDLGSHDILLKFWAYGYEYQENLTSLQVNEVITDALVVIWEPANVTVQYIYKLNVSVDYTFYGGDVPDSAIVNVTIASRTYDLSYVAGSWTGSIPADEIGIGIHQALISAWWYGYSAAFNTTDNLNITATANTFFVFWEPVGLDISYVDTLNLTVIYTHNFSPVPGATVRLSINETRFYDLIFNPLDEMWHLLLDADIIGLGVWNLTVRANQTGYDTGVDWEILTVNLDILTIQPSWTDGTTDYATPIVVTVQLNSSDNVTVIDASMELTILGSTQPMVHVADGEYTTTLGPLLDLGVHSINVTTTGLWFERSTIWLLLNVSETQTSMILTLNTTSFYFDQAARVEIEYRMENGTQVPGGSATFFVNETLHPINWAVSYWFGILEGSTYGVGTLVCEVNTTTYGYETQNSTFLMSINVIPTTALLPAMSWLYVNDSVSIPLTFIDARDNSSISYDSLLVEWANTYSIVPLGGNSYSIDIQSTGLHVGWIPLNLSLSKTGHVTRSASIAIEVRALPIEVTLYSISQYETESVTITARVIDSVHDTPVHWASVELMFQSTAYQMAYDEGWFRTSFSLGSLDPGTYSMLVTAQALDCQDGNSTGTIEVLAKITYTITMTVPNEVVRGGSLQVMVSVTDGSSPVADLQLDLHWQVTMADQTLTMDNAIIQTSADGTAQYEIQVPMEAQSIRILASYDGSVSEWTADSPEYGIQVIDDTPVIPPFSPDPLTLTATIGISSLIVILIVVKKSRSVATGVASKAVDILTSESDILSPVNAYWMRESNQLVIKDLLESTVEVFGGEEARAMQDTVSLVRLGIITPIVMSSHMVTPSTVVALSSLHKSILQEILESPSGISRAEIAHKLNLSVTKVSAIVKELLESSSEIKEARMGRRRVLIRNDSV